ncbi:MAG TPA: ATP-binding protein [Candidatus Dormibacteraeota bacterium]
MRALLRPVADPSSYLALIYSVARLPLALFYLVVLGLAFSLVFTFVGLPLFILFLFVIWWAVIFERELGAWWFGFELRPMSVAASAGRPWLERLVAFLTNPVAWKSLGFALLEIPAGLMIGIGFLAGLSLAVGLGAAPFLYTAGALTAQPGDPPFNAFGLSDTPFTLPLLILAAAIGLAVGVGLLHAARAVVLMHSVLTRAMLGVSEAQLNLKAAQQEAAVEHHRAERSEQERRQLIVNMGHEIRTPIASIRGHAESLLAAEGEPTAEEVRRYLDVIHRESERLGALVDDLLVVARGEAGELRLDLRAVEVGPIIQDVVAALGPIAQRDREIKLVAQLPETALPQAWADRDRLTQVLMNLVRNGITYTPRGGIVSVSAAAAEDHVEIAVADTGVGIAPEDMARIFDRFYRTDESRSRATGGFGLGLGISRDLVEAMSGEIRVESEVGLGSRFTVRLRRMPAEGRA